VLKILSQSETIKKLVGFYNLPTERLYRLSKEERDNLKTEQQTLIADEREKLVPIKIKLTELLAKLEYKDAQERQVQGKALKLEKIRDGFRSFNFPMWKNIREDSLKQIFAQVQSHFRSDSKSMDSAEDNVQMLKTSKKSGTRRIFKRSYSVGQGGRFNQVRPKLDSINELTEGYHFELQVSSDPEMIPYFKSPSTDPYDNSKDVDSYMACFQCNRSDSPSMPVSTKILRRCNSLDSGQKLRNHEPVGEWAKEMDSMKQVRRMSEKIIKRKQSLGWASQMSMYDTNPTLIDFDGLPFGFEEFSMSNDEIN